MTKDLVQLRIRIHLQVRETEQTPNQINPKNYMPGYIIIKLLKTKANILKAVREKHCLTYWGKTLRMTKTSLWKPQRPEESDYFSKAERKP